MKRITPEDAKEFYRQSNATPTTGEYVYRDEEGKVYACPVGAIMLAHQASDAVINVVGEALESFMKSLGYSLNYVEGFTQGFDNGHVKSLIESLDAEFNEGFKDGMDAYVSVFPNGEGYE